MNFSSDTEETAQDSADGNKAQDFEKEGEVPSDKEGNAAIDLDDLPEASKAEKSARRSHTRKKIPLSAEQKSLLLDNVKHAVDSLTTAEEQHDAVIAALDELIKEAAEWKLSIKRDMAEILAAKQRR